MKALGVLLVLIAIGGGFVGCSFMKRNELIAQDEGVNKAWANVESTYQRRLDLIPNLVETVKGATKYEGDTLVKVTEGRNQILALAKELKGAVGNRDVGRIDTLEQQIAPMLRAYTGLAAEAYPQLRATDQFTSLQAELAGTENRINVARHDYNDAAAALNTNVRQWGWLPFCSGFKTREAFKAAAGAEQAPAVKF
jgi:LemA protein